MRLVFSDDIGASNPMNVSWTTYRSTIAGSSKNNSKNKNLKNLEL